ncbi:synaptonemal complex protein 3-like [Microtus ochrogaster]|uniref:Synaptonemal complex protein 3-like n=1 Tax=Microtus ochrogaster TaxID=79684 RepID=A0ABM1APP2_MICOH|nr:synaptonemal complex protein 3-like [Microtus ochrogaster]
MEEVRTSSGPLMPSEKSVKPLMASPEHRALYDDNIANEEEEAEDVIEIDDALDCSLYSTPSGNVPVFGNLETTWVPTRKGDGARSEIMEKMKKIGVYLSDTVDEKKKRMDSYIKDVVKDCKRNIKDYLKFHEDEAQEFRIEYTEKIITVFQQWNLNIKEIGDEEEKLSDAFYKQQKTFKKVRVLQNNTLNGIKDENDEYLKGLENLEDGRLLNNVRTEIKKQMSVLKKKIAGS